MKGRGATTPSGFEPPIDLTDRVDTALSASGFSRRAHHESVAMHRALAGGMALPRIVNGMGGLGLMPIGVEVGLLV